MVMVMELNATLFVCFVCGFLSCFSALQLPCSFVKSTTNALQCMKKHIYWMWIHWYLTFILLFDVNILKREINFKCQPWKRFRTVIFRIKSILSELLFYNLIDFDFSLFVFLFTTLLFWLGYYALYVVYLIIKSRTYFLMCSQSTKISSSISSFRRKRSYGPCKGKYWIQ